LVDGDFETCPDALAGQVNGNLWFSPADDGQIDLNIPTIGIIGGTPPYGYCKYELSGVIYNQVGLGYYFGPAGTLAANDRGIDTGNPLPNAYNVNPITIFVRAGAIDPDSMTLTATGNNVIADGDHTISLTFSPRDLAGNPIIPVMGDIIGIPEPDLGSPTPANWVRNIELLYDFDGSPYGFDSISVPINMAYPVPITIEGVGYSYLTDLLRYPHDGPDTPLMMGSNYTLDIVGYAPSTITYNSLSLNIDNSLSLNIIDMYTNDLALPAISPVQGPWDAVSDAVELDDTNTNGQLELDLNFNPALVVTAGSLDSDFLAINQDAEASFTFQNNSDEELTEYGIDHILDFHDAGPGSELLEVVSINLTGESDLAGRTDANGPGTRYGLLPATATNNAEGNQFHDSLANFHTPGASFDFGLLGLNASGEYAAYGNAFVAPGADCIAAGDCPEINIDRSDILPGLGNLASGGNSSYSFGFTPNRFIGGGSSGQIAFDVEQYLSYYFADYADDLFFQHPVYPADPWITNILVKSIGLDTSGTVGGQQVYDSGGGRDLATITTTSSADLRREIRRNVAVLTRNIEPCTPAGPITLPTDPDTCLSIDTTNNTVVAYYTNTSGDVLTLGDGTSDLEVPAGYRYTVIIEAVDLNLENNIYYSDSESSFGIIVIQDSDGNGGNVYLDPQPTNMVGLLYAEGSLLSSPDAGASLYYHAGAPAVELTNQLFWQGSIASRNTIGGASNMIVPEGVDCDDPWGGVLGSCSQAYDLDFTRRFTTIKEAVTGDEYSPVSVLFSGGGSCTDAPIADCTIPGSLPTTVDLEAGINGGQVIDPDSKSLDAFFIERDNRPVPPGFSSKGGLTSTQEVR